MECGTVVHFTTASPEWRAIQMNGVVISVAGRKIIVAVPGGCLPGCTSSVMLTSTTGALHRAHVASVPLSQIEVGQLDGAPNFPETMNT